MLIWLLGKILSVVFPAKEMPLNVDTKCLLIAGNVDNFTALDIHCYLASSAKHLLFYADFLVYETKRYQFDARMIFALMELYSGVLTNYSQIEQLEKPFGPLSRTTGFEAQVKDVFCRLAECIQQSRDEFSAPSLADELHFILERDIMQFNYEQVLQRFRLHTTYFGLFQQAFCDPEALYEQIFALSPVYHADNLETNATKKDEKAPTNGSIFNDADKSSGRA